MPWRTLVGYCVADFGFITHVMMFMKCGFVTHVWIRFPVAPGPPSKFYYIRSVKCLDRVWNQNRLRTSQFFLFSPSLDLMCRATDLNFVLLVLL